MKTEKNIDPQASLNEDKLRTDSTKNTNNQNQDPAREPKEPGKETWKNPDPTSPEKNRKDPYAKEETNKDGKIDTDKDPKAKISQDPTNKPANASPDQGMKETDTEKSRSIQDPAVNNQPDKETRI